MWNRFLTTLYQLDYLYTFKQFAFVSLTVQNKSFRTGHRNCIMIKQTLWFFFCDLKSQGRTTPCIFLVELCYYSHKYATDKFSVFFKKTYCLTTKTTLFACTFVETNRNIRHYQQSYETLASLSWGSCHISPKTYKQDS